MRFKLAVFLFFVTFLQVFGASSYPTIETVRDHFFAHYKANLIHSSSRILFEKKPDGWYLRHVDYFPKPHTLLYEPIWKSSSGDFVPLTFESRNKPQEYTSTSTDSLNLYNVLPYYGYAGWENDVLNRYSDTNHMASLSFQVLANMSLAFDGFDLNEYAYDTSAALKRRPELTEFNNYLYASILAMIKLYQKDQDAQIQGNPLLVLMDLVRLKGVEYRSMYFPTFVSTYEARNQKLMPGQEPYEDNRQVLFDTSRLTYFHNLPYYRNILKSCRDSSVLLVSGDLDYLLLNSVQHFDAIRRNLVILNLDQLADSAYRQMIERSSGQSVFSVVSDEINEQDIDFVRVLRYVRIRQKQLPGESLARQKVRMDGMPDNGYQIEDFDLAQEYSQLRDLLNFVIQDVDNQLDNGLTRYRYFPTDGCRHTMDSTYLQWKIPARSLTASDLILLDVLAHSSNGKLSFVSTTPESMRLGIPIGGLNGLVYHVKGQKDLIMADAASPDIFAHFDLMMQQFDYADIDRHSSFVVQTYSVSFLNLIHDLAGQEKFNAALAATRFYFKTFPSSVWTDLDIPADLVEYLFILDDVELGREVLHTIEGKLRYLSGADKIRIAERVSYLKNRYM
ncbi:MAG: hypothetical protein H6608_12625 [Flavobacteriales bacterium]|nr:hypothetical protein [Flavobacteriales bacterium]